MIVDKYEASVGVQAKAFIFGHQKTQMIPAEYGEQVRDAANAMQDVVCSGHSTRRTSVRRTCKVVRDIYSKQYTCNKHAMNHNETLLEFWELFEKVLLLQQFFRTC